MKTNSPTYEPAPAVSKSFTRREREALEEIETVLFELNGNEESRDSFLIIVEGKKDVLSLQRLGVRAEIISCANQPTAAFCERTAQTKKKVILLTDWDKKGRILASRLIAHFQNLDVSYDETCRKRLLMYTKKEIKDVESLYSHVTKLRQKRGYGRPEDDFEF